MKTTQAAKQTRTKVTTLKSSWLRFNPNGIVSLSPGLRAASYPGCDQRGLSSTLKGLWPLTPLECYGRAEICADPKDATLSGLWDFDGIPRVARSSQPWAEGCNPVGIETAAYADTSEIDHGVPNEATNLFPPHF